MEARDLNHLFKQYLESDTPFFQSLSETISYAQFIHCIYSLAAKLKKSPETFYALKLTNPLLVFAYAFAANLAEKKILLLSPLESSNQSIKHQDNIPYQELITDQHTFHDCFTEKGEVLFFSDEQFDKAYLFLLSSGSSGRPKAIGHSLLTLLESAHSIVQELGMQKDEVTFLNLPVNHIGGLMIFWRSFLFGGIVSTKSERYDFASFVPLQLDRMLNNEKDLSILKKSKAVLIGGSKLSEELKKKAKNLGINVFETYGMTETASAVLLNGKPIRNQSVKIKNEKFLIKGPTLAIGFYENRVFHPLVLDANGFYNTHDKGQQLSENCFQFIERMDLNFKSGGELINPLLIEKFLKEIPWIKEAIITSVPHPVWNQASCLLYESIPQNEMNFDEQKEFIKNYLKSNLHPYLVPKYIFHFLFSSGELKPSRYLLKGQAKILQSLEIIDHRFVESTTETKQLVVFFHGFLGDKTDMEEWALTLSHDSSSFLFISLPGHGNTESKYFENRNDIFERLSGLIKLYQQGHKLFFYGYSMGGRIALELALNYLQVEKLILESASFGLETNEEKNKRFESDQNLFKKFESSEVFLRHWYRATLFGDYNKTERFEGDLRKKLNHEISEWEKSLEYFSPGEGGLLSESLEQIKDKKLHIELIAGQQDEKYLKHYQEVAIKLQCQLTVIKNSGHNPHKTHASDIIQILNRYLPD